jgi:hypothetical protein
MRVDDAVAHYGTAIELAKQLKLRSSAAITNWRARYDGKVPELYARQLHDMTRGKLRFDRKAYAQPDIDNRGTF